MVLEALGSAAVGLLLAGAVLLRTPARGHGRRALVLTTGLASALFGTALAHAVLVPAHTLAVLGIATACAGAMVSLFLDGRRPDGRRPAAAAR